MLAPFLLLALAACAGAPAPSASRTAAQPQVENTSENKAENKALTPSTEDAGPAPKAKPKPEKNPEKPPKKAPEKAIDLALLPGAGSLLGLNHGAVDAMLGPPDFRRRDDPAEIWQYRHATCVLDVFLYQDKSGDTLNVAHVEVRRPGSAQPATEQYADRKCLYELKQDRKKSG